MPKRSQGLKPDKEWFEHQLATRHKSMRALAEVMGLDVSAVSRTFAGKRKMQMKEAQDIAQFLDAPITEVLKHAGISLASNGQRAPIALAATVDEKGDVHRLKDPRPLPQHVIEHAQAACGALAPGAKIVAAQIRAINGPLAIFDDAVVLFRATAEVENAAVGALAICRDNNGNQIMGKIERARKTGEARVICPNGKAKEFLLQTAAPIITIIP